MAPLRSSRASGPAVGRHPNRDPRLAPRAAGPSLPGALSAPRLGSSRSKVVFSFVLDGGWGELSREEQLQMQTFSEGM